MCNTSHLSVPNIISLLIENAFLQHMGVQRSPSMGWNGAPGVVGSPVVKKLVRIDIPADKYPNVCTTFLPQFGGMHYFNFIFMCYAESKSSTIFYYN